MVDWKDYYAKCKRDMKSSILLYNDGDYGNAAYHLQQSLEKYVKAVLYNTKVAEDVHMHIPSADFIGRLLPAYTEIDEIAKKHKASTSARTPFSALQNQFLSQSEIIMKELKSKDHALKVALWKNSLGLELFDREKDLFRKYPLFINYGKLSLNRVVAFSTNTEAGDEFMKEVNTSPGTMGLAPYQHIAELGRMIAATLPHEDFGRYPREIPALEGTTNSEIFYQKQKTELWELIDTVKTALRI